MVAAVVAEVEVVVPVNGMDWSSSVHQEESMNLVSVKLTLAECNQGWFVVAEVQQVEHISVVAVEIQQVEHMAAVAVADMAVFPAEKHIKIVRFEEVEVAATDMFETAFADLALAVMVVDLVFDLSAIVDFAFEAVEDIAFGSVEDIAGMMWKEQNLASDRRHH